MQLTPAQSQIAKDKHRFRVVNCGRRFGKTTLSIMEMVANAISSDDRRVAYIAPTYQQARDIAWQDLKKITKDIAKTINESRLEIVLYTQKGGTSSIILRGWEAVETLRGQKFNFLVIDEIAMMKNFWENWQEVLRPTLTDVKGDVLFISTPKGFNHFYDLYNLENTDDNFKSFHFTSYDNPHLPSEEIDAAKKQLTEDRFAQEYLADFRKTEGLVYKEFLRDVHVYEDKDIQTVERILGIDFGYTNPACILVIDKDVDAHYWVRTEWYKRQQTNAQIAEVASGFNAQVAYPDPASPEAIEELRKANINIREVTKGKDSIQNGIDQVRELFKQNRIHIHKSCVNLIWELETYSYQDKKPDKNEPEVPIKENDHAMDALRYALMTNSPTVNNEVGLEPSLDFYR